MHRRNIALIVAIILLAGCGAPRDHGTVVVGLEGNPSTLDPRFAVDAYATRILPLLFERLLDTGPDGDVRPALAVSWAVDEDARRYTFHLRGDARFSDGTPLTARDAAATLNHLRDPANKCPAGAGLDAVASVEAPDDTTLVVTLAQPYAPLLLKMVRPVMPAASLDDADFGDYPVGGGPYRLERYERGRAIDLVRNEHYAGPAPAIERVRFEVLPNETTRMLKMRKGEIDLLLNATPPYALKHFERLPGIVVERAPGINFSYLGFNLRDERGIVSRIEVRRAIAHAIDRKRIIDTLLAGQARAADGLLAPENWAHADDLSVFDYDPAKARALLDEVFPDPDGDGPAPRFTLSFKTSTDRLRNRIAEVIARQLAETGIALEKRSFEWGTFFDDIKKGNFQTFSLTWVGVTDPDHLHYVFHSTQQPPVGANRGRYADGRVDGWLDGARRAADRGERRRLYAEAQRQIAEDVVYVPLWWADNVIVRRERLEGFVAYPGGEYTSLATARLRSEP